MELNVYTPQVGRNEQGDFTWSGLGMNQVIPAQKVQEQFINPFNTRVDDVNSRLTELTALQRAYQDPTIENLAAANPNRTLSDIQANPQAFIDSVNYRLPLFEGSYNQASDYYGNNYATLDNLDTLSPAVLDNFGRGVLPNLGGFGQQLNQASARALRKQQGGGGIGEFFRGAAPIAAIGLGALAAPAIAGAFAAPAATGVAAGGATAGGLTGLGSSLAGAFNAGTALSGALTGGLGAALSGGDLKDALLGAGLGGLGGGFGSSIAGGLGLTSQPARMAVTGALTGASGGLATGNLRSAALGAALGAGGGYLKAGGDVPFLGSMEQQVPEGFIGAPRPSTGIIGGITDATNTGLTIGGQPMRLGSLLSAGGDIYGYMQGRDDIEDIQRMQQQAASQAQAQLSPFADAGRTALQNMQAPNMEALMNDPAYQFQLQQGNQAVERSLAARGLGQSGAALKAAQEYGQGLASQTYDDFFNRQNVMADRGFQASAGLGSILGNTANANAAAQMAQINLRNQSLSNILGGFNDEGDYLTGSLGRLLGRFA